MAQIRFEPRTTGQRITGTLWLIAAAFLAGIALIVGFITLSAVLAG